jgi:hypothetical protein
MTTSTYRGWTITWSASRPVTGTYRAERFGVTLSASSRAAIERMVDQRIRDYPLTGGA